MKVLVLGAGIVGITSAYELARDGHEVTVVDRRERAAMETSFSNAGMIAPGHSYTWASPRAPGILWQSLFRDDTALKMRLRLDPAMWAWCLRFLKECSAERAAINTVNKLRLCRYSQAVLEETVQREKPTYDRHTGGALYLYREQEHFDRGTAAMSILTSNGVRLEAIGRDRIVEIEPALVEEKDRLAGAIHCPTDESGDCHAFANALADTLARGGKVRFHWDTEVRGLEAEGGRIRKAVTDKGDLIADAYVLAAGTWSPFLARQVGLRLPIYPVKGYALTIPVGSRNRAPKVCGVDEKYLIGWSRLGDRLRVTAKAEFTGYDTSHREADFAHMLATVRKLFPDGGDFDHVSRWAGLRPMTPRGTPMLGPTPLANLHLNTGHGHIGWTMAHGSARVVTDLIAGRSPAIDLAGLRLEDA